MECEFPRQLNFDKMRMTGERPWPPGATPLRLGACSNAARSCWGLPRALPGGRAASHFNLRARPPGRAAAMIKPRTHQVPWRSGRAAPTGRAARRVPAPICAHAFGHLEAYAALYARPIFTPTQAGRATAMAEAVPSSDAAAALAPPAHTEHLSRAVQRTSGWLLLRTALQQFAGNWH